VTGWAATDTERRHAERLERIAGARGQKPGQVAADLLRDADRSVA